jgi:glycosyltransferase involved in cell wall biosynthesis
LYEGFGFPAGEAMACQVPVVSSCGGALPEVVGDDGSCGTLVPPKDPDALAAAIDQLLDQPERREAMGRAGRARVLQHFTWRRAAERTVEVYCEVINERAHRARIAQRVGAEAC